MVIIGRLHHRDVVAQPTSQLLVGFFVQKLSNIRNVLMFINIHYLKTRR